eukprot:GHVU01026827.1.p1 GENE.GHVU01026827.1~~GHVU01026827.1.p1  ORF type:complete len:109 (-),score=20.49 GHVU01026827.1:11-337(-)
MDEGGRSQHKLRERERHTHIVCQSGCNRLRLTHPAEEEAGACAHSSLVRRSSRRTREAGAEQPLKGTEMWTAGEEGEEEEEGMDDAGVGRPTLRTHIMRACVRGGEWA